MRLLLPKYLMFPSTVVGVIYILDSNSHNFMEAVSVLPLLEVRDSVT